MADNVTINAGSGGPNVRTKERVGTPTTQTQICILDQNIGGNETIGGPLQFQGDTASGTADAGNPVKVGHKAVAIGANPPTVAANARTDSYANRHGIPFVMGGHPNNLLVGFRFNSAQPNVPLVTQGAGGKLVAVRCHIACDAALTSNPGVAIGFDPAATPVPGSGGVAKILYSHPGMPPGLQVPIGDGGSDIGHGADGESLFATITNVTGGNLDIVIEYHVVPS